jgi:hypothetical protein
MPVIVPTLILDPNLGGSSVCVLTYLRNGHAMILTLLLLPYRPEDMKRISIL